MLKALLQTLCLAGLSMAALGTMTPITRAERSIDPTDSLPPGWSERLSQEWGKPYFRELQGFLQMERNLSVPIYPAATHVFRALQSLDFEKVRVVILGQDPYHGPGQAVGLSFAVPEEHRPKPPSLVNIFKEIASDLKVTPDLSKSELLGWVDQGVLLLNTVLTVRANEAFSHRKKGWEIFTDRILTELGARREPLVFVLWGAAAFKKRELIAGRSHLILESAHPSPLSAHRGFWGSKPFSKTNDWLISRGLEPIDWMRSGV
jgi:uracil-DNA glycosylase